MDVRTKVLYVDDEMTNLRIFQINFRKKYEVITAQNGMKGLMALDANPDVQSVISDMRMPHMNGLEFIKQAKEKHPDVAFYILTGFDITDEIQQALNQGLIHKYFKKPFNMKEIEHTIDGVNM